MITKPEFKQALEAITKAEAAYIVTIHTEPDGNRFATGTVIGEVPDECCVTCSLASALLDLLDGEDNDDDVMPVISNFLGMLAAEDSDMQNIITENGKALTPISDCCKDHRNRWYFNGGSKCLLCGKHWPAEC